jgi:hypothetical protein
MLVIIMRTSTQVLLLQWRTSALVMTLLHTSTPIITAAYLYKCVSMLIITLAYQYARYYRGVLVH